MNFNKLRTKLFFASLIIVQTAFIYSLTLPGFSLIVSAVDSSCLQNGELQFSVSGTDPAADITYTITRTSDNVVLALNITDNMLGGLLPDDYEVEATQTLNGESNFESEIVTVLGTYESLDFDVEITNENCADGGEVEIVINSGIFKSLEVISGPMTLPPQGSLILPNLTQGEYLLHILDDCDVLYVVSTTVGYDNSEFTYNGPFEAYVGDLGCNETRIRQGIHLVDPNGAYAFPLTITYTITPPAALSLPDTVVSYNVTSFNNLTYIIPYYGHGNPYLIDIELVDNCGNSSFQEDIVWNRNLDIFVGPDVLSCGLKFNLGIGQYRNPVYINFLSAPVGFDPLDYNPNHPGPFYPNVQAISYENTDMGAPEGEYIIEVVDSCFSKQKTFNLTTPQFSCWVSRKGLGCEEGLGNSRLTFWDPLESATLLSAPDAFGPTPQDASSMIWPDFANSIWLINAPPGVYTFEGIDSCGNVATCTQEIEGLVDTSFIYEVIPSCSKFDLFIDHKTNYYQEDYVIGSTRQFYFLQRYDALNMVWKYADGNTYVPGGFPNVVPELENKALNINYFDEGYYRVLKIARFPTTSFTRPWVHKVMAEFDFFDNGLDFSALYSFQCDDDSYSVISEATGVMPLTYRITDKDGDPFNVDNGDNPVFENLDDGLYTFEVEDPCGNIKIRELEIANTTPPSIQTFNLCNGQEGRLSIDNLNFLDFEWWHNDDPNTILSDTSYLEFNPFDNVSDAGTYSVNISFNGAAACIDKTLTIFIPAGDNIPNAGEDVVSSICPNFGELDLHDLLDTAADSTGTWYDISGAGNFDDGVISSDNLSDGTYLFEYSVIGFCEGADTSLVTVIIGDLNSPICVSQDITISLDEFGQASITENDIDGGSFDDCGIQSLVISQLDFGCSAVGTNPVILTATDAKGNNSSCNAIVTVEDNIAPVAICNDINIIFVDRDPYNLTHADVDAIAIGSSDNCDFTYEITTGTTTYDCDDRDVSFIVTLTVTDASSIADRCTATVTNTDPNSVCNDPPTAVCQDITISVDANCVASIVPGDVNDGSSDPDGDILTFSLDLNGPFGVGDHTVTLIVSDGEYTDTCQSTVTVEDNTPPIAVCQDVTVQLDSNGDGSTSATAIDDGSNDACGIESLVLSQADFVCADVGPNPVTLSVTDVNTNTTDCNASVTVEDNVTPIAICQDVIVLTDSLGNVSITPSDIDNGSSDACGIASYAIDVDNFCCTIGARTVVLTVTDVYGNTSSCTSNVFVDGADEDCDSVHDYHDLCNGGDDTVDNDEDGLPDCFYPPIYEDIIDDWKCGNNKVYICHLPPGNPENAQTLCISKNAVGTHVGKHEGDYLGECFAVNCDPPAAANHNPILEFLDELTPQDQDNNKNTKLYPNPTSDWVTIEFGKAHVKTVRVYATSGEIVFQLKSFEDGRIDMSNFPAGVYQVVIQTDSNLEVHRLVKL